MTIHKSRFAFKRRQLYDYACMAMSPVGGILGHDTGTGKGLALFVIPALRTGFAWPATSLQPLGAVLIVAPGDLHDQIMDEGRDKFKARVIRLDSQETFCQLSTVSPSTGKRELPAGFYITSYTQLSGNGVTPFPKWSHHNSAGIMELLGLTDRDTETYFNQRHLYFSSEYARLKIGPEATRHELEQAFQFRLKEYEIEQFKREVRRAYDAIRIFFCESGPPVFADLGIENQKAVRDLMVHQRYRDFGYNIGGHRWRRDTKIKCVYSASLADLCQDAFAAVAVDEGVKMKGEDTIIGLGVRQMDPAFRLVLTATPIKNRLPDIFRLAWWSVGGRRLAHARFPYPDEAQARDDFAQEFMVSERNLTKEEMSETNSRFQKLTPQVCGIHRLWKIMAPCTLRRRKKDFDEDIVPKIRQPVRVPMGREQAAAYRFHIEAEYLDINGRPAIGAKLQALRIASANPCSELLVRPRGDSETEGEPRSARPYIPKVHTALKLIQQILARGEQVMVFSAFNDSLDALADRLVEAGVKHLVVDGRTSPKQRARLIKEFKLGNPRAQADGLTTRASEHPVTLAGIESVAEGHSVHLCNNIILLSYSWAMDKFEQAINRAHRLNSPWPVNIYPILCEGSIDFRLEAQTDEKSGAAELVLDGTLQNETVDEINYAELLDIARKEFRNGKPVIDEAVLEKEWPAVRAALAVAMKHWSAGIVRTVNPTPPIRTVDIPVITEVPEASVRTTGPTAAIRTEPRVTEIKLASVGFEDLPLFQ